MQIKEIRTQAKKKIYPGIKKGMCLHSLITHLQVDKEKMTAFLVDKRELSIPVSWLTDKSASLSQLQNYEIWDSREIY